MAGDLKSIAIPDLLFQVEHDLHGYIKDTAALFTSGVIMLVAQQPEAVCSAGHWHFVDLAQLAEQVQIAINSSSTDIRIFFDHRIIDFIRADVRLQFLYGLKDNQPLCCYTLFQVTSSNSSFLLVLYIN